MDGSFDPALPVIGRTRSPVRRVTSKRKRSTIGATSLLMQAILVPVRNANWPPRWSNCLGTGMTALLISSPLDREALGGASPEDLRFHL
jgi:hypothetical protein